MNTLANKTRNAAAVAGQRILHPHMAATIEECHLMLDADSGANILLLCGPSGVGKSTLGEFLVEDELRRQSKAMLANPGYVPAIYIEAESSGEKEFSWSKFYKGILNALEGELDAPRTAYHIDPETGRMVRPAKLQTNRLSDLSTAVGRSLRNRGTQFIVVDEAANMMSKCSSRQLENQLNTLKSLSNKYDVQWILLGSYDLFNLATLNAQLTRRTHVMHFGRYREDVPEDVRAFRGCLKKLGESMPGLKDVDLLRYSAEFQQNTLGCIGTLRTLLKRLNLRAAEKGWSEDLLCRALLTEVQTTQILRETLEGEERIAPGLNRSLIPTRFASKEKVA